MQQRYFCKGGGGGEDRYAEKKSVRTLFVRKK